MIKYFMCFPHMLLSLSFFHCSLLQKLISFVRLAMTEVLVLALSYKCHFCLSVILPQQHLFTWPTCYVQFMIMFELRSIISQLTTTGSQVTITLHSYYSFLNLVPTIFLAISRCYIAVLLLVINIFLNSMQTDFLILAQVQIVYTIILRCLGKDSKLNQVKFSKFSINFKSTLEIEK